jgi:hypothetical protein
VGREGGGTGGGEGGGRRDGVNVKVFGASLHADALIQRSSMRDCEIAP